MLRGENASGRVGAHHLADADRRNVGFALVHPAAHRRIKRDVQHLYHKLAVGRFANLLFDIGPGAAFGSAHRAGGESKLMICRVHGMLRDRDIPLQNPKGAAMASLKGKTLFITGASRGIGKAIALRAARDGAKIAIAAKTTEPHPKLPGTIFTAAEEIEKAGGKALACVVDIRDEAQIAAAVGKAVEKFGGIDILVNNASAISVTGTVDTPEERYDLMHSVNVRGTFAWSQACIPHLKHSSNPHILNNSPPLNMEARWFAPHVAYTMSKFGMSLCVLGMAEELREDGIAVNALWPKTMIATAAVQNLLGGEASIRGSRKPEIMADAAYLILTKPSREFTGQFCIDEELLRAEGVTDFSKYQAVPGAQLFGDLFV